MLERTVSQTKTDTNLKVLWAKSQFKLLPKVSISRCNLDFNGITSFDEVVKFMGCFG